MPWPARSPQRESRQQISRWGTESGEKNIWGQCPLNRGTENAEYGEVCGWVSPTQPTRTLRSVVRSRSRARADRSPGRKHILAYFEGHRLLLDALCRCFEFTVFEFVIVSRHFGDKAEVWKQVPHPLPQRRTARKQKSDELSA